MYLPVRFPHCIASQQQQQQQHDYVPTCLLFVTGDWLDRHGIPSHSSAASRSRELRLFFCFSVVAFGLVSRPALIWGRVGKVAFGFAPVIVVVVCVLFVSCSRYLLKLLDDVPQNGPDQRHKAGKGQQQVPKPARQGARNPMLAEKRMGYRIN